VAKNLTSFTFLTKFDFKFNTNIITRNSAIADKPRDATEQ